MDFPCEPYGIIVLLSHFIVEPLVRSVTELLREARATTEVSLFV